VLTVDGISPIKILKIERIMSPKWQSHALPVNGYGSMCAATPEETQIGTVEYNRYDDDDDDDEYCGCCIQILRLHIGDRRVQYYSHPRGTAHGPGCHVAVWSVSSLLGRSAGQAVHAGQT